MQPAATITLRIELFGGLQISRDGRPLSGFLSAKAPALLAYLALSGRPVARETLATLLWGEMADIDARNNLRQTLTSLRKQLADILLIDRDSVALDPTAPLSVDVVEFEAALHAARDCPPDERAAHLATAAALYRGDLLAGFAVRDAVQFEEWLTVQRVRLHTRALHALHALTDYHLTRGDYGRAIDYATRLLALDGWREEAHRQLMLALARSGQRSAALAQYQTCAQLLERELGVAPAAETRALYEKIRAAADMPRSNLPADTTGFVGRSAELAAAQRRLRDPACRLLTLTGPGGVGKTRLALAIAAALAHDFLHGVRYVALSAVAPDEAATVQALIDALGLTLSGGSPPRKQLFHHLQRREQLLLLDNAEHLPDALGWLGDLLAAAPEVKLLVTSRERLNMQAEVTLELTGLPVPPIGYGDADAVRAYGAVALFERRATRLQPDFAVTPANAAAVAQICRLVDGRPLALELAAAWANRLTAAEIATAIGENLDFLATTWRDVAPRNRSLRAVFDHSWRLLSAPEQTLFALLSLFAGSFDDQAVAAVAAMGRDRRSVAAALTALADKSLLQQIAPGQYALHGLLRQYAAEQLAAEPAAAQAAQARHAHYRLAWLRDQTPHLHSRAQATILAAIVTHYEDFRAAWQWGVAHGELDALIAALSTLRTLYVGQARHADGVAWLEQTLAALDGQSGTAADRLRGMLRARLGSFYAWLGRPGEADALLADGLAAARAADDAAEQAFCLLNQAYLTMIGGDYAAAEAHYLESLAHYRQADNWPGIADALCALGAICNVTGDWPRARDYLTESIAISRKLDDPHALRVSLNNLGNIYYYTNSPTEARGYYEEVAALCRQVGDVVSEAIAEANLGTIAYEAGEYAAAGAAFERSLAQFDAADHAQGVAHVLCNQAELQRSSGHRPAAEQALRRALALVVERRLDYLLPLVIAQTGLLLATPEENAATDATAAAAALLHWVADNPAHSAENRQSATQGLATLALSAAQTRAAVRRAQAWTAATIADAALALLA